MNPSPKITFFCEAPDGKNILSFVGHTVSVATIKLCHYSRKAATNMAVI